MQQGAALSCPGAIPGFISGALCESEDVFSIKAGCLHCQEVDSKPIFSYFSRCHRNRPSCRWRGNPAIQEYPHIHGHVVCTVLFPRERDSHTAMS